MRDRNSTYTAHAHALRETHTVHTVVDHGRGCATLPSKNTPIFTMIRSLMREPGWACTRFSAYSPVEPDAPVHATRHVRQSGVGRYRDEASRCGEGCGASRERKPIMVPFIPTCRRASFIQGAFRNPGNPMQLHPHRGCRDVVPGAPIPSV